MSALGAIVTFTDLAPMLPLIEENIRANLPGARNKHTIAEHQWYSFVCVCVCVWDALIAIFLPFHPSLSPSPCVCLRVSYFTYPSTIVPETTCCFAAAVWLVSVI